LLIGHTPPASDPSVVRLLLAPHGARVGVRSADVRPGGGGAPGTPSIKWSSSPLWMMGVPSRVVPLSAANAANTLLQFAVGVKACPVLSVPPTAKCVYQKYVTIHAPSRSSQK